MAESDRTELSAAMQEKLQKLQGLGAQLQSVAQQRSQMELLKSEADRAAKALEGLEGDTPVYRAVGSLLVRDGRDAALERAKDDAETLEVRLKRAKDQEAQLQEQFEALQSELQKALQG